MDSETSTLPIAGLEQMEEDDRRDIAGTLSQLFAGFASRDADLLAAVYTDDADWINAFGTVRKGSAAIATYLRGLFADKNFNDGRLVGVPHCSLRRLSRDHALVHVHLQVGGQGLVGGGAIALRDNHSQRVISRQSDNSWRVVSEMFMDVRQDQSYIGHS
jgi:uncharacterized protein (TIGR02246 family)